MEGLFENAPAATYPAEAQCSADQCGHRNDVHVNGVCELCTTNAQRGFQGVMPAHTFRPRTLAGGALTAADERLAYERSLGGGK